MTQTTSTEQTVASTLRESPAVAEAIETLLTELRTAQTHLRGVRGPLNGHAETLAGYIARQDAAKGRGAYYPYVGSGIGRGPLVELVDGSVKWDMISGIGVHMFGHSDPRMIEAALHGALRDTVMQGNLQYNAEAVEFAETLIGVASQDSNLKHCFLTNSGAMANEAALKICYQKNTPAPRVLAFADCFMGRSTTMAQIGDSAGGRSGLPLNVLVDYMPFYDPDLGERSIRHAIWHLEQYIKRYPKQHACFIMELVQGEGGFNSAPREFFEQLMRCCRDHGIGIWIDEVQTFSRTERMFAFQHLGLGEYVDVVTIGKMSQVCGCLFTEAYNPQAGLLSGTFIGSSVSLHVGRRAIETLRDGGYYGPDGRNATLQKAFRERMQSLIAAHPEWFPPVPHPLGYERVVKPEHYGGIGGMMRFTPFAGDRAKVVRTCHVLFEEGVIAFFCGHDPYHVRFLPPIGVFEVDQFGPVFEIVERALARVAQEG